MILYLLCLAIWFLDMDESFYEDIHYYLVEELGYEESRADSEIENLKNVCLNYIRSEY